MLFNGLLLTMLRAYQLSLMSLGPRLRLRSNVMARLASAWLGNGPTMIRYQVTLSTSTRSKCEIRPSPISSELKDEAAS